MNLGLDDKKIIKAWKGRDETVIRPVMRVLMPKLVGYATRLIGEKSDAEEAVQDALISSFENIGQFEGRSSFSSWIFRIAHHKAIDILRKKSRYRQLDNMEESPDRFDEDGHFAKPVRSWTAAHDEELDSIRILDFVKEEMEKLPHIQKEILIMSEMQGLSIEEICYTLDITPTNYRVSLHRARQRLRKAVDDRFKTE